MWRSFTRWFGSTFGAAPTDAGPEQLVVVFEGDPGSCEIVALRLKTAGLFVLPDPTPDPARSGAGRANSFRIASRAEYGRPSAVVAVLATDEDRARAVLDAVEPI